MGLRIATKERPDCDRNDRCASRDQTADNTQGPGNDDTYGDFKQRDRKCLEKNRSVINGRKKDAAWRRQYYLAYPAPTAGSFPKIPGPQRPRGQSATERFSRHRTRHEMPNVIAYASEFRRVDHVNGRGHGKSTSIVSTIRPGDERMTNMTSER